SGCILVASARSWARPLRKRCTLWSGRDCTGIEKGSQREEREVGYDDGRTKRGGANNLKNLASIGWGRQEFCFGEKRCAEIELVACLCWRLFSFRVRRLGRMPSRRQRNSG